MAAGDQPPGYSLFFYLQVPGCVDAGAPTDGEREKPLVFQGAPNLISNFLFITRLFIQLFFFKISKINNTSSNFFNIPSFFPPEPPTR